ncbi:dynein axonemal assembly factor 3 homolog [Drosophila ficusphila]|uniref:dynein axonemal assembly factor 3 homolog n=1 Tax=Drosophila ficusphila TaxID=30025 RepID=UPI0007E6831B|nr:dynein axonemal assembly factor 3 homolog [Drosophila ficusphila]
MLWGISSALDLYDEYLKAFKINDDPLPGDGTSQEEGAGGDGSLNSLNILICGGADPRHVIKTLAKRYTHRIKPKLNIYVLEGCAEIAARHLLLLGVALEDPESFSLVCKVHLFMDLYGNAVIRPSSHHYMAAKGRALLQIVTDEEKLEQLAPMINIEGLKYKERDGLEMSFSFWQPHPWNVFEITSYWEKRLRALLGTRYDHRNGAFDWDLSMTLKDRGGQQICSQEYRYWRESGVAFVFPEYEHCKPNKTLAAGLIRNGRTFIHRGYVGDIQTGPFCGFGLRTVEERMHHSVHGDNDYRATDITERNLLELFHELQTQTPYEHDPTRSRRYGSVQLLMTPLLNHQEVDAAGQASYDKPWIKIPGVTVHYVSPLDMVQLQQGASRWNNMFDVAFVAYNYYNFLGKEFFQALRPQALFILETKLMTVERKEPVKEFEAKAKELMKRVGLKAAINYQAINAKNMWLKYKKTDKDEPEEEPEVEPEVEPDSVSATECDEDKILEKEYNEDSGDPLEKEYNTSENSPGLVIEEIPSVVAAIKKEVEEEGPLQPKKTTL